MTEAESTPARDDERPALRAVSDGPRPLVQREHARYAVDVDIDVTSDHNFYAGLVENMSAGGVFIATHLERPVGTLVELALRIPGTSTPIRGVGEVRWVRRYNEASDTPPGLGIRFVMLEPGAVAAIEAFLATRDPLFFDD